MNHEGTFKAEASETVGTDKGATGFVGNAKGGGRNEDRRSGLVDNGANIHVNIRVIHVH
jgi:hypothetical protein